MKNIKFPFLVFIVMMVTSCQSFNSVVREPIVFFNSVDIARINLDGVNLIAHIDVENPNGFSIPLPKIDWELFVNDASFVQGLFESRETIGRRERVTLGIPLNFTYDGLLNTFSSLIGTKEAAYNIAIGLSFPIPVFEDIVRNLNFSGVIPLPQLPTFNSPSVRVAGMDYSSIVLSCAVSVDNPNVFPISIPEIDLDFGVGGQTVLKNRDRMAGEIAAGGTGTANFNINVAYADIFRVVESVRNRSEAQSSLSLAAAVPFPVPSGQGSVVSVPVTIPIIQKPEITFQGITRRSLGRVMEFVVNLEVLNRNNFDFQIDSMDYGFMVNNRTWTEGSSDSPPTIRAGSRTVIPLVVSVSAPVIVAEIVNIINAGSPINYTATGNMSLLSGLPGLDIPQLPFALQGSTRIR